jgi:SAM-dependent methyltransferase
MPSKSIAVARELTPPLLWKGMKRLLRPVLRRRSAETQDEGADYYDAMYRGTEDYHQHYTKSFYYFLWCVVVDRVMRSGATAVLDVGCGSGQVAEFLHDRGLRRYCGIDLSTQAIEMAKARCPGFQFIAANVFETDAFATVDFDTVISLEFLEHVAEDLAVLKRIPAGKRFIGTVPDFSYPSHVRFFSQAEEVVERYGGLFQPFSVEAFVSPRGATFFLMEGLKT